MNPLQPPRLPRPALPAQAQRQPPQLPRPKYTLQQLDALFLQDMDNEQFPGDLRLFAGRCHQLCLHLLHRDQRRLDDLRKIDQGFHEIGAVLEQLAGTAEGPGAEEPPPGAEGAPPPPDELGPDGEPGPGLDAAQPAAPPPPPVMPTRTRLRPRPNGT